MEITEALLSDFYAQMKPLYSRADYNRDLETLRLRFRHNGLVFVTKTLPTFFTNVLQHLEDGHASYPHFRKTCGNTIPVLFKGVVRHIIDPTVEECIKVKMLSGLYQICVAFKKLKGPYTKSVLDEQLVKLKSVDDNLFTSCNNDGTLMTIISKASAFVDKIFSDLTEEKMNELFVPRPGPGATNTPTEKAVRYRPHCLYGQLEELMPSSEWHVPTCANTFTYFDFYVGRKPTIQTDILQGRLIPHMAEPTSRFKFVHKEFGKPRGICIEELEMQWRQQALRRVIYDHIENTSKLTRGYVSFLDQGINADLALRASFRNPDHRYNLATIDMSDASNRVSRNLVYDIFCKTKIYKYLDALSTRYITFPGLGMPKLRCNMYAPMGSALCFPVMALVHYSLIKAIISTFTPQHINDSQVWVYGDDILFDVNYTDIIYEWLPRFGMKINTEKSYRKSHFRESCGMNAYYGVNVTPVRFKYVLTKPLSNKSLVSCLYNEGALYKKGFYNTAKLIRSHVYAATGLQHIPFVGRKSSVMGFQRDDTDASVQSSLIQLPRRWHKNLQTLLFKGKVFTLKRDKSPPLDELDLYLRKQVENPEFSRKIDGFPEKELKLSWKWLPYSAFHH